MCFGTQHTTSQTKDSNITYEGVNIEVVEEYKYLGVILDPLLKFDKLADHLKREAVGRLCMMSKHLV